MERKLERRLLQAAIALASIVPLAAGGSGVVEGPAMLREVEGPQPIDLDSHYRYLSGLLLGAGLGLIACVPAIERRGAMFRALGLVVIVGGVGRAVSLLLNGVPGSSHLFGLAMELGAVPLLLLWQRRIERSFARTS